MHRVDLSIRIKGYRLIDSLKQKFWTLSGMDVTAGRLIIVPPSYTEILSVNRLLQYCGLIVTARSVTTKIYQFLYEKREIATLLSTRACLPTGRRSGRQVARNDISRFSILQKSNPL